MHLCIHFLAIFKHLMYYVYTLLYIILNQSITDKNQLMYNLAYVQKSQMLLKGEGLNKIYR